MLIFAIDTKLGNAKRAPHGRYDYWPGGPMMTQICGIKVTVLTRNDVNGINAGRIMGQVGLTIVPRQVLNAADPFLWSPVHLERGSLPISTSEHLALRLFTWHNNYR
jgi:hypothetical protein